MDRNNGPISKRYSSLVACKMLNLYSYYRRTKKDAVGSDKTICIIVTGALGLKLLRVGVPPYILRGEMALLQCQYKLENDSLYSVTWYKDHEEFYRYVPKANPTQHSYPLEGIKVDVSLTLT